jgi:hypothetical protein
MKLFLGRGNRLSFNTSRTAYKTTQQRFHLLLRVFVAAVTFSPSRCLALKGRLTDKHADGRISEVGRSNGLMCHDFGINIHEDCFRHR